MTSGIDNAAHLEIVPDKGDGPTLVRLRGRLNIDSSPAFRDQLLSLLEAQSTQAVVVDLTEASYVDTSGIATLLEGLKIARNHAKTLCLQGLQGRILHLFEVAGLLDLFEANGCRNASPGSKVS